MKKWHIVTLGGGNAMPKAVLRGLKRERRFQITAVCAMLDSGGSTGRLRQEYGILGVGDLRRALLALANTSHVLEKLFDLRFQTGSLKGHTFANLFLLALELVTKDTLRSLKTLKSLLQIKHEVLPITLGRSHLYAELENGRILKGEGKIDKYRGKQKIKRVWLSPVPRILPEVKERIKKADLIILGPGDLFSTLAQILLVKGTSEALSERKGIYVYLVNLLTKKGETEGFSVEDFVSWIKKLGKVKPDIVLFNTRKITQKRLQKYQKEHPELLEPVTLKGKEQEGFIGRDLVKESGPIEHDPKKVATALKYVLSLK